MQPPLFAPLPGGQPRAPDRAPGSVRSGRAEVWRRYGKYLRRPPLLVLEWRDDRTPARGWLVINSLRGGAAGGGTRLRSGLTRRELVYLAKLMELKFLFAGPPIGGAKAGISFDPTDPRRPEVLRRWFRAVAPQLRHYYGTGGDLNVDELLDVIPGCASVGLSHPQEGVVRGHLRPDARVLPGILRALDQGLHAPVGDAWGVAGQVLPLADLVTGYGLAKAVTSLLELQGRPVVGQRVLLEGFGAVGGPCALYLARTGMRVVGIADREKVLLAPDGLSAMEVERLLCAREEKCLPGDARCLYGEARTAFTRIPADVFVAAASSETIDASRLQSLAAQGVRLIACGANQPFREARLGATHVQQLADQHFTVLPDVVANCGMARALSFLMYAPAASQSASILEAVEATITSVLSEVCERSPDRSTGLLAATLSYALDRLEAV